MTELETLVAKLDEIMTLVLAEMNPEPETDLEKQRRELQTEVDIYELKARLVILKK